jgi:hypothetical protein
MTRKVAAMTDQHGQVIAWVTPQADGSPDSLLTSVMQRCLERDFTEMARREAIRSGKMESVPTETWNISDRH